MSAPGPGWLLFCTLFALAAEPAAVRAQELKWRGDVVPPSTAVAPAPATPPPPQASGDYLSRMDRDGDGKVSVVEYQDWLSYAFDGMDRDRDGVLSAAEQPGGRGQPLTREAHRARLAERFRRQDVDRSGFLDAKELAAPPQGQ
ncbi:MAG: hypothetical protein JF600_17175 [Xanthomonadales bacterium]|nr:hypothetical protein [Xanthomonadales bacterium]